MTKPAFLPSAEEASDDDSDGAVSPVNPAGRRTSRNAPPASAKHAQAPQSFLGNDICPLFLTVLGHACMQHACCVSEWFTKQNGSEGLRNRYSIRHVHKLIGCISCFAEETRRGGRSTRGAARASAEPNNTAVVTGRKKLRRAA